MQSGQDAARANMGMQHLPNMAAEPGSAPGQAAVPTAPPPVGRANARSPKRRTPTATTTTSGMSDDPTAGQMAQSPLIPEEPGSPPAAKTVASPENCNMSTCNLDSIQRQNISLFHFIEEHLHNTT